MLRNYNDTKQQGFNLLETLVAIGILLIFTLMGIPAYSELTEANKLRNITQKIVDDIRLTRSESIKHRSGRTLSIITATPWCYGIADTGICSCTTVNHCKLNDIETKTLGSQFTDTSLNVNNLTQNAGIWYMEFEGVRGTVNQTGAITVSLNGKSTVINITKLGLVSICSNDISSYPSCS